MNEVIPKYKIGYLYCKQRDHQSQRTNLVCLNKDCTDNSLICSFCLQQKHKGHTTKPLKHFLQNLQKQYSENKQSTVDKDLEQVQAQKNLLLKNIQRAVQNLANQFMKLQEQVISKYEIIRSQILQRQTQRNRFSHFYKIMVHQSKGDPNFQIQNYLRFQPLFSFHITNELQKFIHDSDAIFLSIKKNLISKNKEHLQTTVRQQPQKVIIQTNSKFKLSNTIKCNSNIFTQSKIFSKQTVGYLNEYLKNFHGKLRIRVINLPVQSNLTLGIAKQANIIQSNYQFPFKNNTSVMWVNSKGQNKSCNYNHITSIQNGALVDILVKKNHCKISLKSNVCDMILPDKESSVFFFSLEGICQIQITYPLNKF